MEKIDIVALYRRELRQWSSEIKQLKPPQEYYVRFIKEIYAVTQIYITYDQKITEVILKLLKSFTFQNYSREPIHSQENPRRKILFTIVEVLYSEFFIDKKSYHLICLEKQTYLRDKLKQFLEIQEESRPSKGELVSIWELIIQMDMVTFWSLMHENGIKDLLLTQVYQKICRCDVLLHDELIRNYVQSIKRKTQTIPEVKQLYRVIPSKRQQKPEQRRERPQPPPLTSTQFTQLSKIRMKTHQLKQRLYDELWFNKAKYQKYKDYIKKINNTDNMIELSLTNIAFEQSLFFNLAHKQKLQNINKFIGQVQKCLQNSRIVSYQFFGSIRSTLALANQFDIDLTSIRSTSSRGQSRQDSREMIVNILFSIRRTLLQSNPAWVSKSLVYHFQKIKVPFLKISFNHQQMERQFKLNCLDKMDITIGNKSAIKNSEMISYFARIPEITCFCLLVKLWAKSNNVINVQTPMKGLSSYGLILMCLYYLMQTSQIGFLEAAQDFDFEKDEMTPNFDSCHMRNIEENFNGFLNFYKETGLFQRSKKVVCLLKNCNKARQMFDDEIVYNMYDFIDKTNPGRMRLQNKANIFDKIERAIKVMRTKSISLIQQLITCSSI